MNASILSAVALAATLCACSVTSQLQPYQEPAPGAETARLRVLSNEIVTATRDRNCFDHAGDLGGGVVLGGHATPVDRAGTSLSMPASRSAPSTVEGVRAAEIRVAASRPLTVSMRSRHDSNWVCNVGVTFTPQPGQDYEASMVADGERKECQARITSLARPSTAVPQESARACAPTL